MSVTIAWPGKTTPSYLEAGVNEYVKRISKFDKIEVIEFKDSKGIQIPNLQIQHEEKILDKLLIKNTSKIILLDERGSSYSSQEFADWLYNKRNLQSVKILFVIGGAYGFSDTMRNKADEMISMSKLTVSHKLIRLLFLEQLYRAYTIINKLPYHHE
jgi:23S rRNA (pseudouridine1915-N3)-methyltransferase